MNRKQYSEIQHCLGVLEGLGTALRGTAVDLFNNTLGKLGAIIDEIAPTVDQPEDGQGEGASNQADDDPPQLWIKYDGDLALSTSKPCGYAYGPKWVAQALWMDDICFETPAAAKAAWEAGIGNKEGQSEAECSPKDMPPLGTVTHEEAVAMFRGIMDRAKANRESHEDRTD